MKKKIVFFLMLAVSMATATVVFNSCGDDKDDPNGGTNSVSVASISLNKATHSLAIGEEYTLSATVLPENATNKTVTWTSSDNTKATVTNGKVTALAAGTVTITAKAGDKTAICEVTITNNPLTYDEGVVINGVKWATRNVDAPGTFAENPESAGKFYQWNRKIAWATTGEITNWDATNPAGTEWIKANDPSPASWRVPTNAEIDKLLETAKVSSEWITTVSGVTGRKFTDRATNASLFLPASGYRYGSGGTLNPVGSDGGYWSSTQFDQGGAYYLSFDSGNAGRYYYTRRNGLSVRPVAE